MERIGVAVLGTGFMGRTHIEALRRVEGVEVVGILGSSPSRSRQAAQTLEVPRAYDSLDEVLDDQGVQSIHVGTPNRLHFEAARRGLEAGKHVLSEKPLAMSSEESSALVRSAEEHPRLAAGVNYNIRFYPLALEARHRVQSGTLGEVFHVTGSYTQDWLLFAEDYNWRVLATESGASRAIADIGTHWLDLVHAVTGLEIESVLADLQTVHPRRLRPSGEIQTFATRGNEPQGEAVEISTEDAGNVLIRFRGGARGNLHVSQVSAGRKNLLRLEIAGSKRSLGWRSESPNELWLGHRDAPNECLLKDPSLLGEAARSAADYPGGHPEGYADTFKQCFRAFYAHVRAGVPDGPAPYPTFEDGHREILLTEAILRSHHESRWVSLESFS